MRFSNLRTRSHMQYSQPHLLNRVEDGDGQALWWKSMTRTVSTPEFTGRLSHHLGMGLGILAPRAFHKGVLSLEIAHHKMLNQDSELPFYVRDDRMVDLFKMYRKCLQF